MNLTELLNDEKTNPVHVNAVTSEPAPKASISPLPDPGLLQVEIGAITKGMRFRATYGPGVTPQRAREHLISLDPDTQFEAQFGGGRRDQRQVETGNLLFVTLEKARNGKFSLVATFQNGEGSGMAKGFYETGEELMRLAEPIPLARAQFQSVVDGVTKNAVVALSGLAKVRYYAGKEKGDFWIDAFEAIPANGGNGNGGAK